MNKYVFTVLFLGAVALGSFFVWSSTSDDAIAMSVDSDGDMISDSLELKYNTDPDNPDTDGDGIIDGMEILQGSDPLVGSQEVLETLDTDGDGLNDWLELQFKSDNKKADTDGDGFDDYTEVLNAYSPIDPSPEAHLEQKVLVDLTHQQLYYEVSGQQLKRFPVSTGNPHTPTPPGEYKVFRKLDVARYIAFDYDIPNVKWNMEFLPSYFIHTAYWHDEFGKRTKSHGCVNMREADAKFLYERIGVGVTVEIIGQTPQGFYVGT